MFTHRSTVLSFAAIGMFVAGAAAQGTPPVAAAGERYVGEMTGDDVYIRSGPSKNYYPVMKLSTGNRVTVVGSEAGWVAIVPPAGAFSLIDANYVDRGDGKLGIVNGNNVNVRAGSLLSGQKYAVQLKLKKNAEVDVIEPGDDGYLKIVPPEGAKLWVSQDFVRRIATVDPVEPGETVDSADPAEGIAAADPPAQRTDSASAAPTSSGGVSTEPPPSESGSAPAAAVASPVDTTSSQEAGKSGSEYAVISWRDLPAEPAAKPDADSSKLPVPFKPVAPSTDESSKPERPVESTGPAAPASVTAAGPDPAPTPSMPTRITEPPPERRAGAEAKRPASASAGASGSSWKVQPIEATDIKAVRAALEALDGELQAELAKPLAERQFAPIIERFRPHAEQSDDEFSRAYAQQRVTFMERLSNIMASAVNVQELSRAVQTDRASFQAARDLIAAPRTLNERGFHAEGQLRTSAVYDALVGPKRYRLVDPASDIPRTLCYLEFASESTVAAEGYLGRNVGIRASARRVQTGDVEPVPIFVVGEMTLLDRTVVPSVEPDHAELESAPRRTATSRVP